MKDSNKYDNELDIIDLKFFVESNIFKILKYLKKNGIYLAIIVGIGFGAGYYLDKKQGKEPVITTKEDRLVQKQTAIVFNYNSIDLAKRWMEEYLLDKHWKEAGLVDLKIEELADKTSEGERIESSGENSSTLVEKEKAKLGLFATDFHYYKCVIIAKEGFDFKLFWKDFTTKIERVPHFAKTKELHQLFLSERVEEISNYIIRLNKLLEKETMAATDLLAVFKEKKALEEELVTLKIIQAQTASVVFEAYEISKSDEIIENNGLNSNAISHKKIQFPIVGLVLFLLGQWIYTINRNYTKKKG
ncbi:AtpZ/AtpI family protein [Myroides sp. WP-1]|uniref:AtpZ/AtpI family protein n=1 Tax=Myroides sp. WP-1 TaxID=2759944 RepID=UPI0015FDEA1C|nr:AtpZ/AtpI family protein [Myroides sp. WP-1]MBB1139432.1 AtpZ/AtpI family protein [Myroides sp. WP-1]